MPIGSRVLVPVVALVALAACGDEEPVTLIARDTVPPVTVDSTPLATTALGSGETSGIEVSIETPAQILVGERLPVTVTIRNTGTTTIYWQAGGCGIPAGVTVGPIGAAPATPAQGPEGGWDGNAETLAAWLSANSAPVADLTQQEGHTGYREIACAAISVMDPFEPGESLSYRSSAETRVAPGPLPAGGEWEVVAAFVGYTDEMAYPGGPLEPVTARIGVAVIDDPARAAASLEEIVAGIVGDGRLASWIPTTVVPGRRDLTQTYATTLEWWRGGWELWAVPYWQGDQSLRVRVNPTTMQPVDVRIVRAYGGPADDEPGATRMAGMPPDQILTAPISSSAGAVADPAALRAGDNITVTPHDGLTEACANLALVYEVTPEGEHERALLVNTPGSEPTWHTAPAGGIPITIPPCQTAEPVVVSYTLPDHLAPGSYLICLDRDSLTGCANFEIIT